MIDAIVKPSGALCSTIATNSSNPSRWLIKNPEATEMPSKKLWMDSPTRADHPTPPPCCGWVSSPKWKWRTTVCSTRVDEEIAAEHQHGRLARHARADRHHLEYGRGQHEACAERHEVVEQGGVPATAQGYDETAERGRGRRDDDERQDDPEGRLRRIAERAQHGCPTRCDGLTRARRRPRPRPAPS